MGKYHEEKIELMRNYLGEISTSTTYYFKDEIPKEKIDHAINKFAFGMDRETIIGFYDTTLTGSGKAGYIFTDDKIYYQ